MPVLLKPHYMLHCPYDEFNVDTISQTVHRESQRGKGQPHSDPGPLTCGMKCRLLQLSVTWLKLFFVFLIIHEISESPFHRSFI